MCVKCGCGDDEETILLREFVHLPRLLMNVVLSELRNNRAVVIRVSTSA